jgi:hypothetical protein
VAAERFVALGLAHVRSGWSREVARWSTSAALPLDFVPCISLAELRSHLLSNRPYSAVLLDAGLHGVDRDLLDEASRRACAVLVVDDPHVARDWRGLGAAAVLPIGFDRRELLEALRQHAAMIGRGDETVLAPGGDTVADGWRGHLVAVTGTGAAGASTAAMALAQALGEDVRHSGMVLLADLCLHADQAMLHDAGDVVPGVQELVDAHRSGRPSSGELRALTYDVEGRGYHLLLGLRRHRDWAALRPRAFESAVDGLRRAYRVVVADVDADVEGEPECGSVEVEERNLMARTVLSQADVALVVGTGTMQGVHALVRTIGEVVEFGVDPSAVVPVVNRAPRNPRSRAAIAAAAGGLLSPVLGDRAALAAPLFLPERRRLDDVLRDGARLPAPLTGTLRGAVEELLERTAGRARPVAREPVPIAPGSLGLR